MAKVLLDQAIVAGQRLQEKINESVTCRFCQESAELVENLGSKNGLGSIWMFLVLGFRAIDGGHTTVSKVLSFLGLSPINRKCSVFPPRPV